MWIDDISRPPGRVGLPRGHIGISLDFLHCLQIARGTGAQNSSIPILKLHYLTALPSLSLLGFSFALHRTSPETTNGSSPEPLLLSSWPRDGPEPAEVER